MNVHRLLEARGRAKSPAPGEGAGKCGRAAYEAILATLREGAFVWPGERA